MIILSACNKGATTVPIGKGNFIISFYDDGSREVLNLKAKSNFPRGVVEKEPYCFQSNDNYSFILGSKGFTLINLKTEKIKQSLAINAFEMEDRNTFKTLIISCNINKIEGEGKYLIINPDTYQLEKK